MVKYFFVTQFCKVFLSCAEVKIWKCKKNKNNFTRRPERNSSSQKSYFSDELFLNNCTISQSFDCLGRSEQYQKYPTDIKSLHHVTDATVSKVKSRWLNLQIYTYFSELLSQLVHSKSQCRMAVCMIASNNELYFLLHHFLLDKPKLIILSPPITNNALHRGIR